MTLNIKPIRTSTVTTKDDFWGLIFRANLPHVYLQLVKKNLLIRKVFNYEEDDSFVYYKLYSLYLNESAVLFIEETHSDQKIYIYNEEAFKALTYYVMEEVCHIGRGVKVLAQDEEISVEGRLSDFKYFFGKFI